MKVAELKKGMLITLVDDDSAFYVTGSYNDSGKWLRVGSKPRKSVWGNHWRKKPIGSRVIMYLGTKKDLGLNIKWTDRFVLVENEIVGVDPPAWRSIRCLE